FYSSKRPRVQVVISDGLNANAVNENLRAMLPPLRQRLGSANHSLAEVEVVIENGRVRAGYHIGALLDIEVIVHFIGERPGTGINTLSAYLTYGRTEAGEPRWSPSLDHSCTTAICSIHHKGKAPLAAAAEIARLNLGSDNRAVAHLQPFYLHAHADRKRAVLASELR